jgi:hypothetical protein
MDIYHTWFNLKPGCKDVEFSRRLDRFLGSLKERGIVEGYRLTRRKLGLGPRTLGEFHVMIETKNLTQLDEAFGLMASRSEPEESRHFDVNSQVTDLTFALYRDFPDPVRKEGEEKF